MLRLTAILRFIRLPLVWTALADVLAGAAVALAGPADFSWTKLWPLLLLSPALYLFGMALNDLLDVSDDRAANRDRPLARGDLPPLTAVSVAAFLLGLACIAAAFVPPAARDMAQATLAAIILYNALAKRWTPTAVPFMAACRVGNILIGWAVATGSWNFRLSPHADYGLALLLAVAALTALASLISGLEKRRGLKSIFTLPPDTVILGSLLLLPVADAAVVAAAWHGSPWAALWLAALPAVFLTTRLLRYLSATCR
jgi:4-hydroxybenzoate polyprenyltransferase